MEIEINEFTEQMIAELDSLRESDEFWQFKELVSQQPLGGGDGPVEPLIVNVLISSFDASSMLYYISTPCSEKTFWYFDEPDSDIIDFWFISGSEQGALEKLSVTKYLLDDIESADYFEEYAAQIQPWLSVLSLEKYATGSFSIEEIGEVLEGISGHGEIESGLPKLKSLSDETVEGLSRFEGNLNLRGLTDLSDVAAEIFSKHKGDLDLEGVTGLSDAAAKSLSKHEGDLFLLLDNLPESAAQILRDAGHGD